MPTEIPAFAWFFAAVIVSVLLSIPVVLVVNRLSIAEYEARRERRESLEEWQRRNA